MLEAPTGAGARTANVRFDPEEWTAVGHAAMQAGVTIGKYVRDAALARAGAEAAAGSSDGANRFALARLNSAATRSEARALVAQAEQAVRHAHELAERRAGAGNILYVGQLWEAVKRGGVPALAELVPPDVIWRPLTGNGRVLRGTRELDEYWSSRDLVMPSTRMFQSHGDDVLVEAEYTREDGSAQRVWLLCRFDGNRLIEAIGFDDESEARSYRAP